MHAECARASLGWGGSFSNCGSLKERAGSYIMPLISERVFKINKQSDEISETGYHSFI